LTRLDRDQIPVGITVYNVWRGPKGGGRGPRIEQRFKRLLDRLGGVQGTDELLLDVLKFLAGGPRFLVPVKLYGTTKTHSLLQVNADLVQIALLEPADRFRCGVCNVRLPWVAPGTPCPACHGSLQPWDPAEVEQNRYARRILTSTLHPLVAGEHTAQITGEERIELEDAFKAPPPGSGAH